MTNDQTAETPRALDIGNSSLGHWSLIGHWVIGHWVFDPSLTLTPAFRGLSLGERVSETAGAFPIIYGLFPEPSDPH
jgi:hypothetical protein